MKNTLIFLAAFMLIALGIVGYAVHSQSKGEKRFASEQQVEPRVSAPEGVKWKMDVRMAETDAEKKFILMCSDYAKLLQESIEREGRGEQLSLDDWWKLDVSRAKMTHFYNGHMYDIRPSLVFEIDKELKTLYVRTK